MPCPCCSCALMDTQHQVPLVLPPALSIPPSFGASLSPSFSCHNIPEQKAAARTELWSSNSISGRSQISAGQVLN